MGFKYSGVPDRSASGATDTLADNCLRLNKRLHLRHLSPECRVLLHKAGDLVEVNLLEDPTYHVADDELA